ncbi:conserved protein of unknown function [Ectopseudomonas oleovorans]|uniref:Uncharacterized protein n=1 Tax=Ectopseudomonas oleovorans TaxID=301 RepID=A0A653B038_ECTOL|nr:conserved protein of unknown function [Pseudomonas oleovorans]
MSVIQIRDADHAISFEHEDLTLLFLALRLTVNKLQAEAQLADRIGDIFNLCR